MFNFLFSLQIDEFQWADGTHSFLNWSASNCNCVIFNNKFILYIALIRGRKTEWLDRTRQAKCDSQPVSWWLIFNQIQVILSQFLSHYCSQNNHLSAESHTVVVFWQRSLYGSCMCVFMSSDLHGIFFVSVEIHIQNIK